MRKPGISRGYLDYEAALNAGISAIRYAAIIVDATQGDEGVKKGIIGGL